MASVCSTSPTNFSLPGNASHPFASSTSPKSSTLYSSSPSHPLHRRTSQHTSPRKSPFTLHANYGSSFVPPLALPRGHDSSDVAALSSSLEEPKGHAQGTRSAIETSLDMAVAARVRRAVVTVGRSSRWRRTLSRLPPCSTITPSSRCLWRCCSPLTGCGDALCRRRVRVRLSSSDSS